MSVTAIAALPADGRGLAAAGGVDCRRDSSADALGTTHWAVP